MGAILGGVAAATTIAGTVSSLASGSPDSGTVAQAAPVDPGPYFSQLLTPYTGPARTAINPLQGQPMANWYTYGQRPEQTFFNNNSAGQFMPPATATPPGATGTSATGAPSGMGALGGPSALAVGKTPGVPMIGKYSAPTTGYARGGATGQHGPLSAGRPEGHFVQGPGNGQSDSVKANLSDGEWVADANFVSALGDGSNAAGAKVLYNMREAVMRDKGMKHIVPPKLKKGALSYAKAAGAKISGGAK